jgi:hypothetical protein
MNVKYQVLRYDENLKEGKFEYSRYVCIQWDTNIGYLFFVILYVWLVRKSIDGFDVTNDISMVHTYSVT